MRTLLAFAALGLLAPTAAAAKPRDLLPDLAQGTPTNVDVVLDTTDATPQTRLVFTSAVANVGEGPLIIKGSRSRGSSTMTAHQVVRRSDGSAYVRRQVAGTLRYVQEPDHQHWHLLFFDRYELWTSNASRRLRRDKKEGFCLGDRYRLYADRRIPHQPAKPAFPGFCGRDRPDLLSVTEGITVGWGDDYAANLEGQYIDIGGVAPGRYLLVHRVNTTHGLLETSPYNDVSCTAIELKAPAIAGEAPSVEVLTDAGICGRTYRRWGVPGP